MGFVLFRKYLFIPYVLAFFVFNLSSALVHADEITSQLQEEMNDTNPSVIEIGVLAIRGNKLAFERWSSTVDYLTSKLPGYQFILKPMNLAQLDYAVTQNSVDFVLTNSGQFVRVGARYGLSWLATLKSRRHPGEGSVIGSALVVRADSNYHTIDDLEGGSLGAVSPLAFGGFQIYWGEMVSRGLEPKNHFSDIRFSQFPIDALAYWVRDQQVNAAVLPACFLETMHEEGLIQLSDFRVLDPMPVDRYLCQTSSKLYPNWSFSKLKSTSPWVAEYVAKALLLMPENSQSAIDAGSLGWTAPVSSYDIHQLYQQLDIHPWKSNWQQTLVDQLWKHWQWSILALLTAVLGFGHHLWVQVLVTRKTDELHKINKDMLYQTQQLEHAQRVAILGELSSEIAHEINQPLAAINSFAEGGLIRMPLNQELNSAHWDLSGVNKLLLRIQQEALRGGKIIDRIRTFARRQPIERRPTQMKPLMIETLALLDYELKKGSLDVQVQLPEESLVASVDPIEFQQLLVNLIRNGLDAMEKVKPDNPQQHCLKVSLGRSVNNRMTLVVADTGCGLTEDQMGQIFIPFYTSKPMGLGLGLSICRRIVEAHQGSIDVTQADSGGTVVTCHFVVKNSNEVSQHEE